MPIATPQTELTREEVAQTLEAKYAHIRNVLGGQLEPCTSHDDEKVTGWHRDGYCGSHAEDRGLHIICAIMTKDFLDFSDSRGYNLRQPRPPYFWGLREGDHWCICATRWLEAYQNGKAPKVNLKCTAEGALNIVPLEFLKEYAVDLEAETPVPLDGEGYPCPESLERERTGESEPLEGNVLPPMPEL
ncbi:unnamed protein product [Amoebophrya sp. A25]|nr:unnamed protein product [Amoebophrya sp. A25]|eukprot:GSA25T00001989001.1